MYQIQSDYTIVNAVILQEWITQFKNEILPNRVKLGNYYDGNNEIVKIGKVEGRPDYSINVNLAKYIVDVSTGYAFGKPVTYSSEDKDNAILDKINEIYKNCNEAELNFQLGGDMATYGVGYHMVLAPIDNEKSIEDRIILKRLNPEQTFIVTDNTILNAQKFAVYYYDYIENKQNKTKCYVYDKENLYIFDGYSTNLQLVSTDPHLMGDIPIIQSLNNDDAFGDFECVTGLLDSLSLAISNNTDNLQSIANAILSITGGNLTEENLNLINKHKAANLPVGAKMEWVVKNINPEAEKLQIDNLLKFLFKISQVPDLSDEAFGGNQSGVAMQYKLWGLNQLWATKTVKFTKSLYQRLKIIMHLLQFQLNRNIDLLNSIDITFYKNLPTNADDTYSMVNALKGVVSNKTLLTNIPIVDDVDAEMQQIQEEKELEADTYGFNNNQELENNELLAG